MLVDHNEDIIGKMFNPSFDDINKIFQNIDLTMHVSKIERMPFAFSNWVAKVMLSNGKNYGLKICVFKNRESKFYANCFFLNSNKFKELPLQKIIYSDCSKSFIPYLFVLYEWIDGEVLVNRLEEEDAPVEYIGRQLGKLLAQVHNLKMKNVQDPGKSRKYDKWGDYIDYEFENSFEYFDVFGNKTKKKIEQFFNANRKNVPESIESRIIHKDFKLQNIIINPKDKIVGLLDLENFITGDRLFDFGIINSFVFKRIPCMKKGFLEEYKKFHTLPENFEQLINFYDFIVYSGHLKRAFELKEVERFWSYENTFSSFLGEDVKVEKAPTWAYSK